MHDSAHYPRPHEHSSRVERNRERRDRVGLAAALVAIACILAVMHLATERMEIPPTTPHADAQNIQKANAHVERLAAEHKTQGKPSPK